MNTLVIHAALLASTFLFAVSDELLVLIFRTVDPHTLADVRVEWTFRHLETALEEPSWPDLETFAGLKRL